MDFEHASRPRTVVLIVRGMSRQLRYIGPTIIFQAAAEHSATLTAAFARVAKRRPRLNIEIAFIAYSCIISQPYQLTSSYI